MARASNTHGAKPAATKSPAKAKPAQPLQDPAGAKDEASAAAAAEAGADAKAPVAQEDTGAGAADPGGAGAGPAPATEQSREQADDAATDRQVASDEGKQPEGTVPPPVAGETPPDHPPRDPALTTIVGYPILRVRSVNQRGRRRSGLAFGPEAIEVDTSTLSPRETDALFTDPELIVEELSSSAAGQA